MDIDVTSDRRFGNLKNLHSYDYLRGLVGRGVGRSFGLGITIWMTEVREMGVVSGGKWGGRSRFFEDGSRSEGDLLAIGRRSGGDRKAIGNGDQVPGDQI